MRGILGGLRRTAAIALGQMECGPAEAVALLRCDQEVIDCNNTPASTISDPGDL